jgi:hypothetical protein
LGKNHRGPQNYFPFLPAFSMAGWTESACLAGKHQEPLFPTVGTPDAGKAAHRITAVKILLKTGLIFSNKPLENTKKHPILLEYFRDKSVYLNKDVIRY